MKPIIKKSLGLAISAAMAMGIMSTAQAASFSPNNSGDMAIVPYYTVNGGFVSGLHVTNRTDKTQVVKIRYHRGKDSNDALDFIVLLSPRDEFTGFLKKNPSGNTAFYPTDNSCTVPAVGAGKYLAPKNGVALDDDGYITVIGMGEAVNEDQQIALDSAHDETAVTNNAAMPSNCDRARMNFEAARSLTPALNLANTGGPALNGVHKTAPAAPFTATDTGVVTPTDTVVKMSTNEAGQYTLAVSSYDHTSDDALGVTYFIRDKDSGLEFGNTAVHFNEFATEALMSNQEYGTNVNPGEIRCEAIGGIIAKQCRTGYDFPNLEGGSSFAGFGAQIGRLQSIRDLLATPEISGDWANNPGNNAQADWVVTFPGQNLLPGGIPNSKEIPVRALVNMWDREEGQIPDVGLVVSPNGGLINEVVLNNEVNVIRWQNGNVLGAAKYSAGGNGVDVKSIDPAFIANRGVATLDNLRPTGIGHLVFNWGIADAATTGLNRLEHGVPTVGITAWKRQFATAANKNYGRIVNLMFSRGK